MTLQVTVNGTTTTSTGSPVANLQNIPFAQLPNCASPPTVFGSCPGRANTYNDWVVYDFPGIPTNATASIRILSGNSAFTDDGCGMFPAQTTNFVVAPLNQPPITIPASFVCSGSQSPGVTFPPGNPPGGTYIWSNDNPAIGVPATGSGNIPAFTPAPSNTTQVANITVDYLCASTTFTITVLPSAGPNFNYVNMFHNGQNGADPLVQCLGDTTSFQAQATPGVTIQSVLWDFGDGSTSTDMNPVHLFQNSGNYTVNLQVTTTDGCTQTSTSTITINPKPVASYTSTPECEYDAINFTSTSTVTTGTIAAWEWEFGDGATGNTANPAHLYPGDGSYPVNLTVVTAAGCRDSITGTQIVYEKPVASYISTTECQNDATNFTDNSTASVNITNWDWDFQNDNTIDNTSQNPSYTYPAFGTYPAELTITDANGCVDDTVVNITVHPLPVAAFNSTMVCPTFATTLTDASTIPGGGTISQWNWDLGNDGSVETNTQNGANTWNTGGAYDVELMVMSSDGCVDSIVNTIVVYPKPVAAFSSTTVCHNDVTNFTDLSTVLVGNISTWEWDLGDGNTDNIQNPSNTYANDGSYNATLIITTSVGCKDTVVNPVNVYSLPIAEFSSSTECLNEATMLTDQTTTASSISLWEWDYQNDATVDDYAQNTSYVYPGFGFYPVHLKVTDVNGCEDDTVANIEVKPLPVAAFTSTEECPFFPATLTDASTVAGGATITNWNWDIDDNGNVDFTTQNGANAWTLGGTYYVELMVETADGCLDSVVNAVNVFPKPEAAFSNTTVCFGTATDFTDNSTVALNNNIVAWDWNFDDGNTSTNQNPSNQYGSHGLYDVTLMIETMNGCRDTITNQIEVYGMPVVNFTMPNVCEYDSVHFVNNTTIPSNDNMTYVWNFGDNAILSVETPTHLYSTEGTYAVNLEATSSNGCIHDTTINVDIYDEPSAQFTVSNNCVYETFDFTDYSNTTSTLVNWDWSFGDGNTSTNQSPTHDFAAEGIYQIQLVVTTNELCRDTNTVALEVYPKPVANFTPTDVCLNTPTEFQDLSTVSTQVFSTEEVLPQSAWDFGDGLTASGPSAIHTYNAPGSYNAQIIVTTNHNCKDTAELVVIVHSNPVASFVTADSAGCSPVTVQFINTSTIDHNPGNYTLTYHWYFDNGEEDTNENSSSTFTSDSHTDNEYYGAALVVTSNYGCKDSIYNDNVVIVRPIPYPDFVFNPDETNVYNTLIDFTDQSIGASVWDWNVGDGTVYGDQHPNHRYADSGYYTIDLRVENGYGCTDSISKSLRIDPVFEVFIPNSITPNADGINDEFMVDGYGIKEQEMYIYDKWGKLLYEGFNLDDTWDGYVNGRMDKTAVYVYVVKIVDLYDVKHDYKGSVTVIR
jgi:gliding motility-associated-like protein